MPIDEDSLTYYGSWCSGSITLPHGTGKKINCVVFTSDEVLQNLALENGALLAGGDSLIDDVLSGVVSVDSFERALATKEMMPTLTRKAARLLGPRGLMPNAKVGTLLPNPADAKEQLVDILSTVVAGKEVMYRTDKEGILHIPVGKATFGVHKLIQNIGKVMQTVFDVKPENFGKGRKGKSKSVGKGTKYLLRAYVGSTQGPSKRVSIRTVDPSSSFFLTGVEESIASANESLQSNQI
jgi:large subunit ribosomal protein L1